VTGAPPRRLESTMCLRVQRLPSTDLEVDEAPRSAPTVTTRPPAMVDEELVAALFVRLHAIALFPDSLTAGRLCIEVIEELVPCRAILLHLFDETRGGFLVADVTGAGECEDALLSRSGPSDPLLSIAMPLLAIAMPGASAFSCNDLSDLPVHTVERLTRLGGARRIMVAPVMANGRCYGAIELIDPLGDADFERRHEGAVAYVAARYAEFLLTHEAILDIERVARHAFAQ
jgi:hypothetical protein